MTWDEQQRYQVRLAELTLSNPSGHAFTASQLDLARKVVGRGELAAPEPYSFGDALSDFGAEFANQAEELNPLSDRNRGTLAWWMMLLGLVAVAGYFATLGGVHRARLKDGEK